MPLSHTSIYEHLLSIDHSDRNDVANLERLVRGIKALGFESVRIYLISGDRRHFNCVAHSSASEHSEDHESSIDNPFYSQPYLGDWDSGLHNKWQGEQTSLERLVVREQASDWIIFPLALRGFLMGFIIADVHAGQVADNEKLRLLPVFASQAIVVIANSNWLPSLQDDSPGLSELINSEAGLDDSVDVADVLSSPCKAAVEILKVDHCGMVLFDSTQDTGYVVAEYPAIGVKGLTVPLRGFPDADHLNEAKDPITFHISDEESFPPAREILRKHQLQCTLVVPIYHKDRLIGSLGLDMKDHSHKFNEEQLNLCRLIAKQAALVIENAEIYERNKRREGQLDALQSTTAALRSSKDLNEILNVITRRVVDLLEAKDGGIYQHSAERDELTVIADYEYPKMIGTTLKVGEGLSGKLVKENRAVLSTSDYHRWPHRSPIFAGAERFGAVMGISLRWQNRILGVLYVNDKAGRQFPSTSSNLPQPVNLLVSTAAIAIHNAELVHEAKVARDRIQASLESSKALTSLPDSARLLQDIAKGALDAAGGSWVRLVKFEENIGKENFLASIDKRWLDPDDHIRPNGISMEVLSSKEPYVIEDTRIERRELNPALLASRSRAAVCMRFGYGEKNIGVIWIHYDAPRRFLPDDLDALRRYLEQASIAYESAVQKEELGPLRLVADQIAAAVGTEKVLERIVDEARSVLQADAVAVWEYADSTTPYELSLQNAVTAGLGKELLQPAMLKAFPIADATKQVMANGWLAVADIDKSDPALFSESGRAILRHVGARSLQGLALRVGNEDVGILYAISIKERTYGPKEIRRARMFALHAAMALKAARLVDDVDRTQLAVPEFAKLVVLGRLKDTLRVAVDKFMEVLKCDAVTLFVYNQQYDKLEPYTTIAGVWHEIEDTHCANASRESIVYQMLFRDFAYKVSPVANDPLFRDQPFAIREDIKAVCAVPLKFRDERVGVLFVNYRRPHRFSKNEDRTIELFANQVAVAIRNARLFEDQDKRFKELEALAELSKRMLGAGKLKKILKLAVDNVAESLTAEFVAIVLPDENGRLRIKEVHGWSQSDIDVYDAEAGDKFQTDYTIAVGKPVVVLNYDSEPRFKTPLILKQKGIKSGLSVPMFRGEEKVGAMLVHSLSTRLFTEPEAQRLTLIANLTAIAISQFQRIEEEIDLMTTVQRASHQISSIDIEASQKDVLDKLAHKTAQVLPQAYLVTIELTEQPEEMPLEIAERKRKLVKLATPVLGPLAYLAGQLNLTRFESVYPEEWRDDLTTRILLEKRTLLERASKLNPQDQVQKRLSSLEADGKLGIAKRAIRTKRVQNVPDVSKDPDYLNLTDRTKSELSVPLLLEDGTAIGVINVESERLDAFDEADVQALETLARLAAAVTHNVAQYKLLEGTLKLVESSTLLAWFGMASSMWGHAIEGDAINISNNIMLLRRILDSNQISGSLRQQVEMKLQVIEKMAVQIRATPTTALLSYEEGVSDIDINKVIRTRMTELWLNEYYERVTYRLRLEDKNPLVRCNTDWIKRLLEILVDNAVEAMSESRDPLLTIGTDTVEGGVEITVSDTGPGIPPQIQSKLFKERINKAEGAKGLGIALLIVQAVARVYKGQSKVRQTGPEGTTMSVWLPLAKPGKSSD